MTLKENRRMVLLPKNLRAVQITAALLAADTPIRRKPGCKATKYDSFVPDPAQSMTLQIHRR